MNIKRIGKIGQIISIVILVILVCLSLYYHNISTGTFIISMGILYLGIMGFVISTMCVVLGPDTEKHITSKKILQHFGELNELND